MSRVLVVVGGNGSAWTGAERMAWKTAEHLAARGHTGAVLTDSHPPAPPDIQPWPRIEDPGQFPRPDVVHAFDLARPENVALAMRIACNSSARLALTSATSAELWPDQELGRAACRDADVLYALTHVEAETLVVSGAAPSRIRLVPQAPHLAGQPDGRALRARLGNPARVVLFLGRRTAFKGYPVLLAAAPRVWCRRPETVFVLAGPGDGECNPDVPADHRIRDLGVVDDAQKHHLIAAADVLCLPSVSDVFPLVFVEAWACGTPVVSGPFRGARDVVRHGVDGLVARAEPDMVADALIRLLDDVPLRTAMSKAGRERVKLTATWGHVAAAVEAGYPAPPIARVRPVGGER